MVRWSIPVRVAFESLGRAGRPRPLPVALGQVDVSGDLCRIRTDLDDHRWWRQGPLWVRDGLVTGIVIDGQMSRKRVLSIIASHAKTLQSITWNLAQRPWDKLILQALAQVRSPALCLIANQARGSLEPVRILADKLYALWVRRSRTKGAGDFGGAGRSPEPMSMVPSLPGLRFFGSGSGRACFVPPGSLRGGRWLPGSCRPVSALWPPRGPKSPADQSLATGLRALDASDLDPTWLPSRAKRAWSVAATGAGLSVLARSGGLDRIRRVLALRVSAQTVAALVSRTSGLLELGLWGTRQGSDVGGSKPVSCGSCLDRVEALALASDAWIAMFRDLFPGMKRLRALLVAGTGRTLRSLPPMGLPRLEMLILDTTTGGQPVVSRWLRPFVRSALPFVQQSRQTGRDLDARTLAPFVEAPIETLVLRGRHCSNDLGPVIAKMSYLRYLDLSGCRGLDGRIVSFLAKLAHLQVLNLADKNLRSSDLAPLSRLTGLEVLNLAHNRLDDSAVRVIQSLRHLKVLQVSLNPALTSLFVSGLSRLSGIEALAIAQVGEAPLARWPVLTSRAQRVLASFAALQHLDLAGWRLDAKAMGRFLSLRFLRSLRMDLVGPEAAWLRVLPRSTGIEALEIGLAPQPGATDAEGRAEALVEALRRRFVSLQIGYDNVPGVTAGSLDAQAASRIPIGW